DQKPRITCPHAKIKEADERALANDRVAAERLFAEALDLVLQTEDPYVNNEVCWLGSIHEFATMVMPACERAIALAPKASKDWYKDSRGLARALTGDTTGAIEDFTVAIKFVTLHKDTDGKDAFLRRREAWIATLREDRNPFNTALLKSLRTE